MRPSTIDPSDVSTNAGNRYDVVVSCTWPAKPRAATPMRSPGITPYRPNMGVAHLKSTGHGVCFGTDTGIIHGMRTLG